MNFKTTIAELSLTLEKSGFSIVEHSTNYAKFQSKLMTLSIGYNPLEHEFSVFLGKNNGEMCEIWENVYIDVFGTNFQGIKGVTFVEKFIAFLQNEGSAILKQDLSKIDELEAYSRKAAQEYTTAIINRQNLNFADKAWRENNYNEFIEQLSKVAEDFLPKSYELKRKIAFRKIERGG
jgi:hypothetical protein